MIKTVNLGGENVPVDPAETEAIKNFVPEGFTLLGFKNRARVKPYYSLEPPLFVAPLEDKVAGSGNFFDALVKTLIKQDKVAIARIRLSERSAFKFAALVPQDEHFDEERNLIPCGFHLIFLPFADNLRRLDDDAPPSSDPNQFQIESALALINQFTIDRFDIRNFENPGLQKFYTVLQAFALNEKEIEKVDDSLQPDTDFLLEKLDVFKQFNAVFGLNEGNG